MTPPPPIASTSTAGLVKPNGSSISLDTATGQIAVNSQQLNTRFYNAGVGAQVQAGSTINPTHSYHRVTGSTPITHITLSQGMSAGNSVVLIPDSAGGSLLTGGNIAANVTLVQNRPVTLTYDGSMFYPSYT